MIENVEHNLNRMKVHQRSKLVDRCRLSMSKYTNTINFYKNELNYTEGNESKKLRGRVKKLRDEQLNSMFSYCYMFYNNEKQTRVIHRNFCLNNDSSYSFFKSLTQLNYTELRVRIEEAVNRGIL